MLPIYQGTILTCAGKCEQQRQDLGWVSHPRYLWGSNMSCSPFFLHIQELALLFPWDSSHQELTFYCVQVPVHSTGQHKLPHPEETRLTSQ